MQKNEWIQQNEIARRRINNTQTLLLRFAGLAVNAPFGKVARSRCVVVLNVISRSPTNVQPVLDAIVATGARLCEAEYSLIFNVRDGMCTVAASNNTSADFVQYMIDNPVPLAKGGTMPRAALEGAGLSMFTMFWRGLTTSFKVLRR